MARRQPRTDVVLTDPRAIRALAHPARVAVIDALYGGSALTATECAEIAGLSPSAMSYHLRALEKHGIVRRAPATGDGRERPWEAAGRTLMVDAETGPTPPSPAARAAQTASLAGFMERDREGALAWLADPDREWTDVAVYQRSRLLLTEEEALALQAELSAVLDPYRRTSRRRPPAGARPVRLAILLAPG